MRYTLDVAPRQGSWIVSVAPASAQSPAIAATIRVPVVRAPTPPPVAGGGGDLQIQIERGQYDQPTMPIARVMASASAFLDQITQGARSARATDVYLGAGARPQLRVGGELSE